MWQPRRKPGSQQQPSRQTQGLCIAEALMRISFHQRAQQLMLKAVCRYDGWVTEMQDEQRRHQTAAAGLDNLLYSGDAGQRIFVHLALTTLHLVLICLQAAPGPV